jgi:AAA15 family ATPase/GTPase
MLTKFYIQNFRCFEDIQINDFQRINLIAGKNNSGKTALLEALFLNYSPDLNSLLFLKKLRHDFSYNEKKIRDTTWSNFFYNKNLKLIINLLSSNNYPNNNHSLFFENNLSLQMKNKNEYEIKDYDLLTSINNFNLFVNSIVALSEQGKNISYKLYDYEVIISDSKIQAQDIKNDKIDTIQNPAKSPSIHKVLNYQNNIKPIFSSSLYHKLSSIELVQNFDLAVLNDKSQYILNILQKLDPSIIDIRSLNIGEADIYLRREGETFLPISLFGDCFNRVLDIILRLINTKNSVCLIDEIENGIHYQNQREFWRSLFKLAVELDIQIFATTHSLEMIKAFADVGLEYPNEGAYFELARHEKTNQIVSIKRDLDVLQYSLKHEGGIGLRGE